MLQEPKSPPSPPPMYETICDDNKLDDTLLESETSRGKKCLQLLSSLDVEPYLFLVMFGYGMQSVTQQGLLQEKACLSLLKDANLTDNFTNVIDCHNLTSADDFGDFKDRTQIIANDYKVYFTLIEVIPSAIWSLFVGPWSDKYNRKIPMAVSVFGMALFLCLLLVNSVYMSWPLEYMLIAPIPSSAFGGMVCILSCTYSHLSETTAPNLRVLRYGLLEVSFFLGMPIGTVIGGVIYDAYGYQFVFGIAALILIIAIIWVVMFVHEKPKPNLTWKLKTVLYDLFNCQNVAENVRTCTKPRGRYFRKELLLMILSMCCYITCYTSLISIQYFYAQKVYQWGLSYYSEVTTIISLCSTGIMGFAVPLSTRTLKLKDVTLGIVGAVSLAAANIAKGFSYQPWIYILGSLIGALSGFGPIAIRSRISKVVDPSELGKVFSILSSCESLMPIAGNSVFTQIYNATLDVFPGLVYVVGGGIALIPCIIFFWLAHVSKSQDYQLLEAFADSENPDISTPRIQTDIIEDADEKPIIS